jgi:hypothetical protein
MHRYEVHLFDGATMVVIDAKPKPAVREHVADKREKGECLQCDCPIHARGLCKRHYLQLVAARNEVPLRDRPAFEAKLIRDGKVAAPQVGNRGVKNPFKSEE